MAAADIHHRTPEFRALFLKVLAQLKVFVGTQNDVLLLSCSGTGAMEASVSNLTSPGDRVLVLTAGKFGERRFQVGKIDFSRIGNGRTVCCFAHARKGWHAYPSRSSQVPFCAPRRHQANSGSPLLQIVFSRS